MAVVAKGVVMPPESRRRRGEDAPGPAAAEQAGRVKLRLCSFAILLIAATVQVSAEVSTVHTVPSGRVRLAAELVAPEGGAARKPAVVFTPGAGSRPISEYTDGFTEHLLEEIFLPRDVAVFYVNKRGIGGSTGNWKWSSFESRAEDVLAAVAYLRALPGIDPDRIGIAGHSQGGWVVQLAGSLDSDLAFVLSFAGPAVTVAEQDLRRVRFRLECEGLSPVEVEAGVAKRKRALERMGRVGRWLPFFQLRLMSNLLSYEPAPALRSLEPATFLAFGELDDQAPPADSISRLREIFGGRIPSHITVHVEPGADHYFREAKSVCFDWEAALGNPYRESFQHALARWVDAVLGTEAP